jgi:6-pyruvoyltetrahydropterin/6-carboxytetrahydropterin synthase
MYTVIKQIEISAAHSLSLSYPSKCENLHGHNWIITIYCCSRELNADGMVIDFSHIKQVVKDQLDHRNLNEVLPFNPTAENIAKWICDQLQPTCFKVEVKESEGNTAIYAKYQ